MRADAAHPAGRGPVHSGRPGAPDSLIRIGDREADTRDKDGARIAVVIRVILSSGVGVRSGFPIMVWAP